MTEFDDVEEAQRRMAERTDDLMETLVTAASRVREVHRADESGRCPQPGCRAGRLPGRCLAHRIADEVISTWANRIYLPEAVDPEDVGSAVNALPPGRGVVTTAPVTVAGPGGVAVRHPAGTRIVRTLTGHPAWCTGTACREPDGEASHLSAPDRVANVMVTLMHMEGEPPVVTLTDLANEKADSTVVVPVAFATSLAEAVRLTGLRAMTDD